MRKKVIVIIAFLLMIPLSVCACDDTLIMLLTAQNPSSEFSKSIRSFMTSLTILGSSLKNNTNPPFDKELRDVMNSWMEFSKRYMANPPDEARNDMHWVEKTNKTAKSVGEIRKFIVNKEFEKAHDKVLALSVQIGEFFEAFGVSDEKQLFIRTSSEILTMQRQVFASDFEQAEKSFLEINKSLSDFKPILPTTESAGKSYKEALDLKEEIFILVKKRSNPKEIDLKITELQVIIEKLRSLILMKEWFPGVLMEKGVKE